jgi:hypothetical protein
MVLVSWNTSRVLINCLTRPWTTPKTLFSSRVAHVKEMWDQVKAKGLKKQAFAPKKGQALIWHANLIHGGGAPYGVHANKTRKSFVVHFDLLRKRGSGRGVFDGKVGHGTNKLLRHDCNYVLSDPMLE